MLESEMGALKNESVTEKGPVRGMLSKKISETRSLCVSAAPAPPGRQALPFPQPGRGPEPQLSQQQVLRSLGRAMGFLLSRNMGPQRNEAWKHCRKPVRFLRAGAEGGCRAEQGGEVSCAGEALLWWQGPSVTKA